MISCPYQATKRKGSKVPRSTPDILYKSIVRPLMSGCTVGESELLESLHYDAAKLATGAMKGTSHYVRLLDKLVWEK